LLLPYSIVARIAVMPQHQADPDRLLEHTDGESSAHGSRHVRRRATQQRRHGGHRHHYGTGAVRYHHYLNVAYLAPSDEGDDEYDETGASGTDHYNDIYVNESASAFDQLFNAESGRVRQEWDAFTETTEEQQRNMLHTLSSSSAAPKVTKGNTRHDTERHRDFLTRIDRRCRHVLRRGVDLSFLEDMEETILVSFFPQLVKSTEAPINHVRIAIADSFHRLTFHALCQ